MVNIKNDKGFTLIEILLVVVMIGIMMAVIVPRGQRANTDSKYSIVRQNCSELASYANDWVEQQMLAQDSDSTSTRLSYFLTLAGSEGEAADIKAGDQSGETGYIAQQSKSNWNNNGFSASASEGEDASTAGAIPIVGRHIGCASDCDDIPPEAPVESIIDPAKIPVNPFNSVSVFAAPNDSPNVGDGGSPVAGAIACFAADDASTGADQTYFALVFQGIESTDTKATGISFHSGMSGDTLPGLRNGTFLTRTIP